MQSINFDFLDSIHFVSITLNFHYLGEIPHQTCRERKKIDI